MSSALLYKSKQKDAYYFPATHTFVRPDFSKSHNLIGYLFCNGRFNSVVR